MKVKVYPEFSKVVRSSEKEEIGGGGGGLFPGGLVDRLWRCHCHSLSSISTQGTNQPQQQQQQKKQWLITPETIMKTARQAANNLLPSTY